jgi:hypothetical protein
MMTTELIDDLETRWCPTAMQIAAAKALMSGYPGGVTVFVPIALRNKVAGIWTEAVEVDPIEGVYVLAYTGTSPLDGAVDYSMAREIVEFVAKANSQNATGSYATIRPDGTWAVWEI